MNKTTMLALNDLLQGLQQWRLWGTLGWNEILQRYRRSLLGPFWLTASMAVMVVALGIVYAEIFKITVAGFVPFLCVSLLLWGYISSALTDAGTLFTSSESYIKQIKLPYSLYVYKFIWSKIIIFAHNFIIYFGVLIYFQFWPGAVALYAIPGFLLVTLNAALASFYLGMASARFRDIPQIVASVVQILFFITPIMWKPELLRSQPYLIDFNPFFHLLEIVRAPLLGQTPTFENYLGVAIITGINIAIAALFFLRFRSRIAYWI